MGEHAIFNKVSGTFSSLLKVNSKLDCQSVLTVISAFVNASFLHNLIAFYDFPSVFHQTKCSSGRFFWKFIVTRQKNVLPSKEKKILLPLLTICETNLLRCLLLLSGQLLLIQSPMIGKVVFQGSRRMRSDLSMLSGPHCSFCWLITCSNFSFLTKRLLGTLQTVKVRSCLLMLSDSSSPFLAKLIQKGGREICG